MVFALVAYETSKYCASKEKGESQTENSIIMTFSALSIYIINRNNNIR